MQRRRKPGRPPKTATSVSPRERLLRSAGELFYRKGIATTGVDELTAHAGVSKMSLYSHFRSKDRLAAAYVDDMGRAWQSWLDEWMSRGPAAPGARLLHVFDGVGEWMAQSGFCGCPFINAAAQLNDASHPAFRAATSQKAALRARFLQLAREAGLRAPERVARELALLADGAMVAAAMERSKVPVAAARAAAATLVAIRRRRGTSSTLPR